MADKISEGHLRVEDIEYLSLEGGGGKGFAYLGAIDAFNSIERWNWNRIKGFAGSSAGAITAMLLSININTEKQISEFMEREIRKETFFEPPNPRYIPRPGKYLVGKSTMNLDLNKKVAQLALLALIEAVLTYQSKGGPSNQGAAKAVLEAIQEYVKESILSPFGKDALKLNPLWLNPSATEGVNEVFPGAIDAAVNAALKQLSKSIGLILEPNALTYFESDMGLFPGKKIRDVFDKAIAGAMRQSRTGTTFEEHYNYFHKELVITGSNLTTGKTVFFSAKETPKFPVADAVRISMSLPFIFKPYVIQEKKYGYPPCGLYVDGGVFNNSPLHAFDDEIWSKQDEAKRNAFSLPLGKTLGLRLEIDKPSRLPVIDSSLNIYNLLWTTVRNGIFGTGESQVLDREVNRYITLDTFPLGLLAFDPPKDTVVFKRSRRAVYEYFELEIESRDKDDKDHIESSNRREKASNPCSAG